MTEETTTGTAGARYFRDPNDGGIQEVHNLGDDAPYRQLGYEEITEADYLAAIEAIEAEAGTPEPTDVSD